MAKAGAYVVIEGASGVGKSTIIKMLADKLRSDGLAVRVMKEPDCQNDLTAKAIRHLIKSPAYPMNSRTEVLLYNAARSQSLESVREAVASGVICLVDRSYLSTLAVQYYGRGQTQDYQRLNEIIEFAVADMQPDLMLVLDAPVSVVKERLAASDDNPLSETDDEYLERVRAGYLWEAKQRGFPLIYTAGSVEDTFAAVYDHVEKLLSQGNRAVSAPAASVGEVIASKKQAVVSEPSVTKDQPSAANIIKTGSDPSEWLKKSKDKPTTITEAGVKRLESIVTNTKSSVYGFTDGIAPLTIAAAMARLSRRGDDMRITLLDEFVDKDDKDGELLKRVITAYGDDSVQQLVGQYVVVENASNLLTKKLEWGRLAAYLEQSTRYIYFDQKDSAGKYRYYTPENLTGELRETYELTLDAIFDIYSSLVARLTDYVRANSKVDKKEQDVAWRSATKAQACDAIRPLLPVATKSTVGIFASGQALESLIMHLLSDELDEAKTVGQQILDEVRKVSPAIFERADRPDRGGATIAYRSETYAAVKNLAQELLPPNYSAETEPVTLISHFPQNELDIVADMLYEHSDLPLNEIKKSVQSMPYNKKLEVFEAYIGKRFNRRQKPGRALENIHYTWDLVCDYGIFRDLQRHRMVDDMNWQHLSPRYGFEVPKLVEDAGATEAYEACFELSLKLHSKLVAAGFALEAQYATLLGHRMRWRVTMNAREATHFNELRTTPQGHPGYRKLVGQMHDKLREVHPLLAESMRFVNQDEDPELTRLAAERYTKFKLDQMDKNQSKKSK